MGNICGCCGGNDQAEKHEYTPIATSEPVRQQAERTNEKSSNNFQTILDNAASGFLFTKPKYKDASSPDGIDAVRNRIKSAKVDLSTIEASPILIRPTSVGGGNGDNENHNESINRQNVVSLLSNPGNSSKTKKLESRAVEIVQVIRQSEEKVISYQQENLPLASFGKGSEK